MYYDAVKHFLNILLDVYRSLATTPAIRSSLTCV